jgi:arginine decarboxylase
MIAKLIPRKVFFTSGVGTNPEQLESFEVSLRDAGVEKFNLTIVSSTLPSKCEVVTEEGGLKELKPEKVAFRVMSGIFSNEPGRTLSFLWMLTSRDTSKHGYISDYHAYGENSQDVGECAIKLAGSMYSTLTNEASLKTFVFPDHTSHTKVETG